MSELNIETHPMDDSAPATVTTKGTPQSDPPLRKNKRRKSRYSLNKNKYLLPHEFDRLMHILETYNEESRRDCTLLLLGLFSGARASELLNLEWSDIDEHDQTVLITGLKGSNDREIPLPPWLFLSLMKLKGNPGKIFPISYNRLRQIWQFYRPVEKKLHCLRHTFAIRLYQKTKDIRLVQVALGHRNIANTMVYAEYVYSKQELKRLIL